MKLCDFCDAEVIEGGKQEGGEDHTILGHRSAATDDDDDEDEDDWWWLVIAWRSNSPQTNPLGCNPPLCLLPWDWIWQGIIGKLEPVQLTLCEWPTRRVHDPN